MSALEFKAGISLIDAPTQTPLFGSAGGQGKVVTLI